MAKPKVLGVDYGHMAEPVRAQWLADGSKDAAAKLKSLATFEARARANPLTAGDSVQHDRWPKDLARDYGHGIPNLSRFELTGRWRGYYSLVGEPGGCRVWVLYLWDHETYDKQSGYRGR